MRLSDYADRTGIRYRTAWNHFHRGEIPGAYQLTSGGKEDLMEDFVSIITSFVARLYGLRRSKRRTEKLIAELKEAS